MGNEDSSPPARGLRAKPRQERSERRIVDILNAAARVIGRIGYKATTTNHVAAEAEINVATLYRWFPDMGSLTDLLTQRYTEELIEVLQSVVIDIPELRTPELIGHILPALAEYFGENPALGEILSAGGIGGEPGGELRESFVALAADIIGPRVPDIPEEERLITAQALVTVIFAFLTQTAHRPNDPAWVNELVYVATAYVTTKYPAHDDLIWKDENHKPRPVRPGTANIRAERIAADRKKSKN